MKKRVFEVFFELMKNSKKSDRDIAKKLSISQPTVTRIRKSLEKSVIKAYTLVPSFSDIGVDLMSFNFGTCDNPQKNIEVCLKQIAKNNPQIIFISSGEGMRRNCVMIALHKDYRDYVNFITKVRSQCKGITNTLDSFLTPTTKEQMLDFANPVMHLLKGKHYKS